MAVVDAGVHLPLIDFDGEGLSYRRLAETVGAARECGLAAISAKYHFLFCAPWLDGLTSLAAVVERSGGMKLVTTLALATLHGPVPLAKSLPALDVLSGGRMIAGVGPGSSRADYEAVGVPFGRRRGQRHLLRHAGGGAVPVAAVSRCGSEAGVLQLACAASPVLAMAGWPPRTTPPRRPSPRP